MESQKNNSVHFKWLIWIHLQIIKHHTSVIDYTFTIVLNNLNVIQYNMPELNVFLWLRHCVWFWGYYYEESMGLEHK